MEAKIKSIYGDDAQIVIDGIEKLMVKYERSALKKRGWVSQKDVMLITYGGSIWSEGEKPLSVLNRFLERRLSQITDVHILPCFPFSSDDGFSIVDYREINPDLGDWDNISEISSRVDLMLDAVINHCSKSSLWFKQFLAGNPEYKDYFIVADPDEDYSKVTRPRTLPLLTAFETAEGTKHLWTTFSDDQIDLNFKSPKLFLEILDILALYSSYGARFIRLDAIGFMYKKRNTSCMHLPETHMLIQIMRGFLDRVSPGTMLVTETNVPHKDNVGYFGDGDEAQMVYQFPLPPLVLFSFLTKNSKKLSAWADSLGETPKNTTFFNFLASHDGIGMRPTEGILNETEIQLMVDKTIDRGGLISYKDNGNGTKSPYELNINYTDALTDLSEDDEVRADRAIAAHVILLSFKGVPGIYIHSILGSRNDTQGAAKSGINRRINRECIQLSAIERDLEAVPLRKNIYESICRLIEIRKGQEAFSPDAAQEILFLDDRIFSSLRTSESGQKILVLVNVSDETVCVDTKAEGRDLICGGQIKGACEVKPRGFRWIEINS